MEKNSEHNRLCVSVISSNTGGVWAQQTSRRAPLQGAITRGDTAGNRYSYGQETFRMDGERRWDNASKMAR